MEKPGERKKRRGEAKGSKALAGDGKSLVLRVWRVLVPHISLPFGFVDGSLGLGGRDVAIWVQSKIALRMMAPSMETPTPTGRVCVSVKERELASVPPRKEP